MRQRLRQTVASMILFVSRLPPDHRAVISICTWRHPEDKSRRANLNKVFRGGFTLWSKGMEYRSAGDAFVVLSIYSTFVSTSTDRIHACELHVPEMELDVIFRVIMTIWKSYKNPQDNCDWRERSTCWALAILFPCLWCFSLKISFSVCSPRSKQKCWMRSANNSVGSIIDMLMLMLEASFTMSSIFIYRHLNFRGVNDWY